VSVEEGREEKIEMEWEKETRETTLDGKVMRWEVSRAIRKLRNGKAVGGDRVVGEVLRYGGEWMEMSVWKLCAVVFERAELPAAWMRAVKVPVRKKGSGQEFEHYRGCTVLSVVGKVFGMVVEARLREFCESRGLLSEWQFGFRAGRACRDPLFVVTELLERRGGNRVFAGFLDVAKAYDCVWRDGMWSRLKEIGVRGKMLKVIMAVYARNEVGVKVGGVVHEWYEELTGLRQGCVMSPLLFAIYVNDLPKEIEERGGGGIQVGGRWVRCLMFADDVILVATTKEGLQRSLEVAEWFARRWRFSYNFGPDKTAVLVAGGAREGEEWVLCGKKVPVVTDYKYLGVRLKGERRGRWEKRREEMLRKARGSFWRAWGLGMARGGLLSAKGAKRLYEILVRPVLEHAAEVDSEKWEEAEKLQRMAGRMCLGVGKDVPNEVVEGELGWWSMRGRREYLRLMFWGEIVSGRGSRVVIDVYKEGRKRVREGRAGAKEWCVETKRVLEELGMDVVWEREDVGDLKRWKNRVKRMIGGREEFRWRGRMIGSGNGKVKTSLERYMVIKNKLRAEWFLGESRAWVRRWVKMRGGVQELEVSRERGRRVRRKRVCYWCELGCVEDERHFWGECKQWEKQRTALWKELWELDKRTVGEIVGWGIEYKVNWLMRGGNKKVRMRVMKGMTRWMYEREKMGRGKIGKEKKIVMEVVEAVRDIRVGELPLVEVGGGVTVDGREWHREAAGAAIEAAIRAGYVVEAVRDIRVGELPLVEVGGGVAVDGREWHREAAEAAIEAAIRAGYE
jgi:hypothetical protein